jgi:hypothetical protein
MSTRGGARPGAGRPRGSRNAGPDVVAGEAMLTATDYKDALKFCLDRLNDRTLPMSDRSRIAIALLPYQHCKLGEIGKKERAEMEAERIAGKFAQSLTEDEAKWAELMRN